MQGIKREVYKQGMTSQEAWNYIKAIAMPVFVLLLSMFTISIYSQFGSRLIAPLTALMWGMGVIEALIMSSQRKEILNHTLTTIGLYQLAMLGWREVLKLVSNVTTEQIMASYNQVITQSQSSALPGYIQTAMWFTAVLTPVGYIGFQGRRIFQFRKRMSKEKAYRQYTSIRD